MRKQGIRTHFACKRKKSVVQIPEIKYHGDSTQSGVTYALVVSELDVDHEDIDHFR